MRCTCANSPELTPVDINAVGEGRYECPDCDAVWTVAYTLRVLERPEGIGVTQLRQS